MKVSVQMVTFNHEQFIAKAIDSLLMQRTNFDYEIVIGEDCSTDNTRNILLEYNEKYPGKFVLLLNEKNLGMQKNGSQALRACKGEYVALLEGDDYWTCPEKLQKQVDFLDSHPECATCFHDALIVHEDGIEEPKSYRPSQKDFSTVTDLLFDNFIPTSSVMFRRCLFAKIPDWISTLKMGDWPFHILNAHHGKVGYIDETMSIYVVHRGGVWSTKDWQYHVLAIIEMFEVLENKLEPKYAVIINRILRWRYFYASELYEKNGDLSKAKIYLVKSVIKHFFIICEPFRLWKKGLSSIDISLPNYMNAIGNEKLVKCLLRLYVIPVLRIGSPGLYRFIGNVARRLKVGL